MHAPDGVYGLHNWSPLIFPTPTDRLSTRALMTESLTLTQTRIYIEAASVRKTKQIEFDFLCQREESESNSLAAHAVNRQSLLG